MHDAVPFTVGEEVKTGKRGVLTLTGYNRNTIGACYGKTFGAELHDATTTLLIVHGAELRDFTLPQLDDFAWLTADELGVVELSLVNFGGKSGFAIGRLKKNYVLLWCISSPGTAVSSFGYDSAGFVACATAGANFIRQNQGLPALTLDHKSNPLKCIQGNTKALFEQAEIALFDRSQKGFIAPSVAGGEKGIRTAYCLDNGDGSLSLAKAGTAGADLMTDPRIPGLKGEKGGPIGIRKAYCVDNGDGSLSLAKAGTAGADLMTDPRIPGLKGAAAAAAHVDAAHVVADLYHYMETHVSLPPSTYVDDTGTTKNDPRRQAFHDALNLRQNVSTMANFVSQSRNSASNNLHRVWDECMVAKDDPSQAHRKQLNTSSYTTGVVARLYQYMEEHTSLPPARYVDDDTGTTKNDPLYCAFTKAFNGSDYVRIMAHFVSQSRVAASNNLHRVWDERMEAKKKKNRKRKGQPTLAEAFKKACKKKKD